MSLNIPVCLQLNGRTPIRVHCEAPDCNALLQVYVNPFCDYESPAIVRCGACRRLLEVDLDRALAPFRTSEGRKLEVVASAAPTTHAWPAFSMAKTVSTGNINMTDCSRVLPYAHRPIVQTKEAQMIYASKIASQCQSRISLEMLQVPRPLTRRPRVKEAVIEAEAEAEAEVAKIAKSKQRSGSIHSSLLANSARTKHKRTKTKSARNLSPYNTYMRQEMKHILATSPKIHRREAFRAAARNWAKSPNRCASNRFLMSVEPDGNDHSWSPTMSMAHSEIPTGKCGGEREPERAVFPLQMPGTTMESAFCNASISFRNI